MIVEKRRGEKWSSVLHTSGDKFVRGYIQESKWFKLCQQERKAKEKVQHEKLRIIGEKLEQEKISPYANMSLSQLKRLQKRKRIVKIADKLPLQTGICKGKHIQRYYTYEGVLYPYVRGKIPSKHAYKLKGT